VTIRLRSAQEINRILADPAASFWLKNALRSALSRDPVDAANDAEVLARLLVKRCQEIPGEAETNPRIR
jgi:hypothetical protein